MKKRTIKGWVAYLPKHTYFEPVFYKSREGAKTRIAFLFGPLSESSIKTRRATLTIEEEK